MGGTGAVGRKVSHYQLQERLGSGGMGEVYLARDLSLGRPAAIKLLPPGVDASFRGRLLREARSAARLQHPAIATLYESGEESGEAFIAMEYVRGETLRASLKRGALPIRKALSVAANVLEALGHAHAVGILHRDIKPENIMVVDEGSAKLLDFGLAKPVAADAWSGLRAASVSPSPAGQAAGPYDERDGEMTAEVTLDGGNLTQAAGDTVLTEAGHVVGTPGYMSPEQIHGHALAPSSDLFAVGAVLYEAITGRQAFAGSTRMERMRAVFLPGPSWANDRDEPLRPDNGGSPELRSVIERALTREPSARFQSAAQFLAALRGLEEWAGSSGLANSLAVLEFANASATAEDDWIGSALAAGVTSRLSGDPEIQMVPMPKVKGTRAAMRAAGGDPTPVDVGLRLACRWVLSGSFRRTADSLRVTAHVTDVPVAEVALTRQFEGTADAVLEAHADLCEGLLTALRMTDRSCEARPVGTASTQAYERYARGRHMTERLDKDAVERGVAFLEEAVQIDPRYADAHAALGRARALRFSFTGDEGDLEEALRSARESLRLDPDSADGHYTLGYVALRREQLPEGIAHLRRAMELAPTDLIPPYMVAGMECRLGRREVATALLQRVVQLNPAFGMAWINLGWTHMEMGSRDEAVWCLNQAVQVEGLGSAPAAGCAGYLGECLRRMGRLGPAREACLTGLAATERTNHIYRDTFRGVCLCSLGRVALDQQDLDAAAAAFTQATTHVRGRPHATGSGYLMVQALAGLARAERSAARFEEAAALFDGRGEYRFTWLWACSDDFTLLELALAARALGREADFSRLLQRARDAGLAEALLEGIV